MHPILRPVAFFLTVGVSLSALPQTSPVNRIAQAIDDRETVVLQGNVRPLLRKATDEGRMDGGTRLQISMSFKKTSEQEAALEALLAEQQDPHSANYHKWLTPQQFADRFGMTSADIATVTAWLQSQGFSVDRIANSRTQIWFSGPVSKIETVFRTEMHNFQLNGRAHFANATELSVPAALSDVVLGFANLDNFRPKSHLKRSSATTDPVLAHFTSNLTGNHSLIPGDFATIYNVTPLYAHSPAFDGTGQKLVVVGQTALFSSAANSGGISPPGTPTDVDAFRSAAGLPARTASNFAQTVVPGTGTPALSSSDIGEASLDVEWSWGIAKGASLNYVYVGNLSTASVFDALHFAIDNKLAPVISISYGNCESALGSSIVRQFAGWAQQANAQGQTITAASGDFGAADCDTSPTLPAKGGAAVDIPAALPYVTGVGGTEFTGDAAATPITTPCTGYGATTYWQQSCSLTSGASAISYIPETTWNDTNIPQVQQLDGTGGGASIFFSKPSWQTGTGVPSDGARDVPDIALNASNTHDSYLYCSQGSCVNGFRDPNTNPANGLTAAGGTSFGAPTFAGILTILNQATGSAGQGNANPTLYAVAASTPSAFHDITTGNNIVPCGSGTPDCPTTGTLQYGFSAGAGYDQVTGLGTPDVNALVSAWSSGNPTTADYSVFANVASISAPGGSATSTISVDGRNGFGGTVTLACSAPSTGAITCSINPTSVTLSGTTTNQTATLTIKTTAASRDRHDAPLSPLLGGGAVMAGVFLFGIPAVRRRWNVVLALIMVAFLMAAMGCGGSKSSGGGGGGGTPTGNYTVTVTATSGSTTHTTNISVTVI